MSLVAKRLQKAALKKADSTSDTGKKVIGVDLAKGEDKTVTQYVKVAKTGSNNALRDEVMKSFDMYQVGIESDLAQLKQFSSIEDKAQYKSEVLANNGYLEYIEQYKTAGANHPNMVLAWVFIWLVDLERWADVIALLPLMIEQQQPLPTRFKTTHWGTFVFDQLYDIGAKKLEKDLKGIVASKVVKTFTTFIDLYNENEWDIKEIVAGKVFAMAGKLEQKQMNFGNALTYYLTAQRINDGAGVKKVAKDLAKQLDIEIEI